MSNEMQEATISRAGEIHFPTWVKVVSSIMGLCFPVGIGLVGWGATEIVALKMEVAGMRPIVEASGKDRYTKSEATADKAMMLTIINRNVRDIEYLQQKMEE